ncbi:uncharacterized protein RBU33_019496 isoform 2-T2 [Hipposideros larvatus]
MISGLAAGFLHLSQATMSVLVPDEELSPGRFVCPAQDQRDLHQHPGIFSSPLHMMLEAIKGQQILTKPKDCHFGTSNSSLHVPNVQSLLTLQGLAEMPPM